MREQNVQKLIEKNINWNSDVIKWYLNNDSFPDFCWFNWNSVLCAFSNWFWWFLTISSTQNNEFSWLLKRWNIYYQIGNGYFSRISKLFNNDKNYSYQCSNFPNYIDKTDKNWDWMWDITIYNSKCFLETYLRTKKYNTDIYIYEYSKQYSEEEWLDWITWTWEYWTHISDIVKTINSDWTINYSVIWKNWKIIFKESNLHWLSLIDLDKNWYKDIITFEKYKSNDWIEYKLLNIYQYDTEKQKYNLNLKNIDSTSIKNFDINWDWKDDLVIQRLDWRSYIYTNKWFVEWFVQNNEIEWDRFELIDINWDWNRDLISFKFFWWSQDYWTYNIFLRKWTNFEKINDSEWFIWNNLKNWKEKCWTKYLTFYIEKQWKRKYIYFNNVEWKYKWVETLPLLNNDDNFFSCWYQETYWEEIWILEFIDNSWISKLKFFLNWTWNNEFNKKNMYSSEITLRERYQLYSKDIRKLTQSDLNWFTLKPSFQKSRTWKLISPNFWVLLIDKHKNTWTNKFIWRTPRIDTWPYDFLVYEDILWWCWQNCSLFNEMIKNTEFIVAVSKWYYFDLKNALSSEKELLAFHELDWWWYIYWVRAYPWSKFTQKDRTVQWTYWPTDIFELLREATVHSWNVRWKLVQKHKWDKYLKLVIYYHFVRERYSYCEERRKWRRYWYLWEESWEKYYCLNKDEYDYMQKLIPFVRSNEVNTTLVLLWMISENN